MTHPQPGAPDHEHDDDHEHRAIDEVRRRLLAAFGDRHSPAYITTVIDQAVRGLAQAPIRDFVPLLVERNARDHLHAATDTLDAQPE